MPARALRGRDADDAGIAIEHGPRGRRVAGRRTTIWRAFGAPSPKPRCSSRCPSRESASRGSDAAVGIPVRSPSAGAASSSRIAPAAMPYGSGRAHSRRPHAAKRSLR